MSPKLTENIQKGLKEQSKMVHLDSYHQGEVTLLTDIRVDLKWHLHFLLISKSICKHLIRRLGPQRRRRTSGAAMVAITTVEMRPA